jgi:hypothetical protein
MTTAKGAMIVVFQSALPDLAWIALLAGLTLLTLGLIRVCDAS